MACGVVFGLWMAGVARGDEATGLVRGTGYGKFTLVEKNITRLFRLSQKATTYDPDTWRPTDGDEVLITYVTTQSKRGELAVVHSAKLLKAGPATVVNLQSPVVAEVIEAGQSGFKAKVQGNKMVKFLIGKQTQYVPAGWSIQPGQWAKVEFHVKGSGATYGINYLVDKVEKVDRPK
jgi:hypothetical protein